MPESAGVAPAEHSFEDTEGTTILAVRYRDGVLVAGDRRATMGNLVVYDRADKVLSIDDESRRDSQEIARWLDERFPTRPLVPADCDSRILDFEN